MKSKKLKKDKKVKVTLHDGQVIFVRGEEIKFTKEFIERYREALEYLAKN